MFLCAGYKKKGGRAPFDESVESKKFNYCVMFTLLDPPSREENTSCSLLEEGLREVMFFCAGNKKKAAERILISLSNPIEAPFFYMYFLGAGLNPHLGMLIPIQSLVPKRHS